MESRLSRRTVNRLLNILGKKKRKVLIWCVTSLIVFSSCSPETEAKVQSDSETSNKVQVIQGETQGTTFGIKIVESSVEIQKSEIDSILHDFDMSLSGYIPESLISQLNASPTELKIPFSDKYFFECLSIAEMVSELTDGAFDPTVLPLMELWGFLKDSSAIPSQAQIDSTLSFVGFNDNNLWVLDGDINTVNRKTILNVFIKNDPRLKLDFNAIAQGYSVDVLGDYLRSKGCKDFYIEIGGEILVAGKNPDGENWRIGIDKPVASNDGKKKSRVISEVVTLTDKGIATSGNYRKFYKKNGKIYAHTLDPKTGRPAENEMLSASVVAENAAEADGLATAFMVMGLEKSKSFLKTHSEFDALLIYRGKENGLESFASEGMVKMLD